MPLRKIRDFGPDHVCAHPEHNPPTMIVLSPGVYEHVCPACGKKQTFVVNRISSLSSRPLSPRVNRFAKPVSTKGI